MSGPKFQVCPQEDEYIDRFLNGAVKRLGANKYLSKFIEVRHELENAKGRLDHYPAHEAHKITRGEDPFSDSKRRMVEEYSIYYSTNAWLKCYELVTDFKLISGRGTLKYFDNASFPGAFILACAHICSRDSRHIQWYASSLIGVAGALGDDYCIYKNNRDHYIMTAENKGDVTSTKLHSAMAKLYSDIGGVDLYTSDIASGSAGNYDKEEELNLPLHCGQIICALLILAPGGRAVFKTFTYSHPMSINAIQLLAALFDEVYISKPTTSRRLNAETYIVCKGYKRPERASRLTAIIKHLRAYIAGEYEYTTKVGAEDREFIDSLLPSLAIHRDQAEYLNTIIDRYEKIKEAKAAFESGKTKKLEIAYNNLRVAAETESALAKRTISNNWFRWAKLRSGVRYPFSVGC